MLGDCQTQSGKDSSRVFQRIVGVAAFAQRHHEIIGVADGTQTFVNQRCIEAVEQNITNERRNQIALRDAARIDDRPIAQSVGFSSHNAASSNARWSPN